MEIEDFAFEVDLSDIDLEGREDFILTKGLAGTLFGMKNKERGIPILEMINLDMRVKNERIFARFFLGSATVPKLVKNEKVKLSISNLFETWLSYNMEKEMTFAKVYGVEEFYFILGITKENVKCAGKLLERYLGMEGKLSYEYFQVEVIRHNEVI